MDQKEAEAGEMVNKIIARTRDNAPNSNLKNPEFRDKIIENMSAKEMGKRLEAANELEEVVNCTWVAVLWILKKMEKEDESL